MQHPHSVLPEPPREGGQFLTLREALKPQTCTPGQREDPQCRTAGALSHGNSHSQRLDGCPMGEPSVRSPVVLRVMARKMKTRLGSSVLCCQTCLSCLIVPENSGTAPALLSNPPALHGGT